MTRVAYLEWMEHKIVTESHLLDHTKWPCRKKQWNAGDAKYAGSRNNDNSWSRYNGNRDYRQSDEEFFAINDMIKNDERISSKKLFLLYIKMDDPNGINKDAASIAWTPLAKVLTVKIIYYYVLCVCNYVLFLYSIYVFNKYYCVKMYLFLCFSVWAYGTWISVVIIRACGVCILTMIMKILV